MIELLLASWLTVADRWEPYHLTPLQQEWFRKVRPYSASVYCCALADGYPAEDWKREDGKYFVLLEGKWWPVPERALVLGVANPVGVPVVWLTTAKDAIRCFVPGPEN